MSQLVKSMKTDEHRQTNRQAHTPTYKETDRQTDRQTDRHTYIHTKRQTDRQADRYRYTQTDRQTYTDTKIDTDRQSDRQTVRQRYDREVNSGRESSLVWFVPRRVGNCRFFLLHDFFLTLFFTIQYYWAIFSFVHLLFFKFKF